VIKLIDMIKEEYKYSELINFGAKNLEFKRLLNSKFKQKNQGNPKIK